MDNKTTVLRVYPDCPQIGDPGHDPNYSTPQDITARIQAQRGNFFISQEAFNSPIFAYPLAQISRGSVDDTLNFRLQAWHCTGTWVVDAQIFDEDDDTSYSAPFRLVVYFPRMSTNTTPSQVISDYRLRVFVVRIIYTGPDADGNPTLLGPTSERSMILTLSNSVVSRMFPVSGINYTGSITAEFNGDLRADGSGTCGAGWDALIDMLRKQRAASSSADVVLGLLPETVPPVPTNPGSPTGCGHFDGVAAAFASNVADGDLRHFTVAHELGHAYGRRHAPCNNPANPDTAYPTYFACPSGTACPSGSIGEWGFDTTTLALFDPQTVKDFMSNCRPPWVSPYTYLNLRNEIYRRDWVRAPTGVALAPTPEAAVERDYLYLNFRAYREGRVELLPSFHLSGAAPVPEAEDGPQSRVVCELLDAEGRIIGFHRCHHTDPNADPDRPYRDFHERVPWESETRSIRFLRDGEEVDEVEVEQQAPHITTRPITELDDRGNWMRLEWEGQHETESITYLVRYSNDGGENWLGLAADLTERRFEVDLDTLPGERAVFSR